MIPPPPKTSSTNYSPPSRACAQTRQTTSITQPQIPNRINPEKQENPRTQNMWEQTHRFTSPIEQTEQHCVLPRQAGPKPQAPYHRSPQTPTPCHPVRKVTVQQKKKTPDQFLNDRHITRPNKKFHGIPEMAPIASSKLSPPPRWHSLPWGVE